MQALALLVLLEDALYLDAEFLGRKWLADEIRGTELHRLHGRLNRSVRGHDQHFGARRSFLDATEHLHPIHVRHAQVGDDQVRSFLLKQIESTLTSLG